MAEDMRKLHHELEHPTPEGAPRDSLALRDAASARRFVPAPEGVYCSFDGPIEFLVLGAAPANSSVPKDDPQHSSERTFWTNLIWVVVSGVALSWWLYYYTDWFTTFTGILSLGGILSWVATLMKVVPEDSTKSLRDRWYRWMCSPRVGRWSWRLLVIGLAAASCFTTIEVRSVQDSGVREVRVYREGQSVAPTWLAPPQQQTRWLVWAPWFAPQHFNIKVGGYPVIRRPASFPWKEEVLLPGSMYPPYVLLRASPRLIDDVRNNPVRLVVRSGERELGVIEKYNGKSVWVGFETDLEIPAFLLDEWRIELAALPGARAATYARYWFSPLALESPSRGKSSARNQNGVLTPLLQDGQILTVELHFPDGHRQPTTIPVKNPGSRESFPQVGNLGD